MRTLVKLTTLAISALIAFKLYEIYLQLAPKLQEIFGK